MRKSKAKSKKAARKKVAQKKAIKKSPARKKVNKKKPAPKKSSKKKAGGKKTARKKVAKKAGGKKAAKKGKKSAKKKVGKKKVGKKKVAKKKAVKKKASKKKSSRKKTAKKSVKRSSQKKTAKPASAPSPEAAGDIFEIIRSGDLAGVRGYVEGKGDMTFRDEDGMTSLAVACERNKADIVEYLLASGADVNEAQKDGFTPLMYAITRQNVQLVGKLLDHGAQVNHRNKWGNTSLFILSTMVPCHVELAKLLLDRGADPTITGDDGSIPLDYLKSEFSEQDFADYLTPYLPKQAREREISEHARDDFDQLLSELATLQGDALSEKLHEHFKPWLLTDDCAGVFADIMARLERCEVDDSRFILWFNGEGYGGEGEAVPAYFYKPAPSPDQDVYAVVVKLHSEVVLGDEDGYGTSVYFPEGGYDAADADEQTHSRFSGFCDAGHNWFVLDDGSKNSLGEASVCLWDHGLPLSDAMPYPGQDINSYNYGGFLLRVLAFLIYANSNKYGDFSYG